MLSRFDPEARIAMMQATEEANELGHSEVGPDHVLLGLLSNLRGSTFVLLTEHGLRLDSAREVVVARRAALAETQPSPTGTPDSDVPDPDPGLDEDREALRAIGIDLDKVREAVRSTFGDDITEQWGERRAAVEVSAAAGTTTVGAGAGADHEAGSSPTVASSRTPCSASSATCGTAPCVPPHTERRERRGELRRAR